MFLGIKCYVNQAMDDKSTIPSVNICRIGLGIKLEKLVYVGATEVEINRPRYE